MTPTTPEPIVIKNCLTCAHRLKSLCVLTGFPWMDQRRQPNIQCDAKMSGWQPRAVSDDGKPVGLLRRVWRAIRNEPQA